MKVRDKTRERDNLKLFLTKVHTWYIATCLKENKTKPNTHGNYIIFAHPRPRGDTQLLFAEFSDPPAGGHRPVPRWWRQMEIY